MKPDFAGFTGNTYCNKEDAEMKDNEEEMGVKPGYSRYDKKEQERESKYGPHYKWIALSNTTLGAVMVGLDMSILLIALPAIFNGLGVNPLVPANISLLIWLLLGYTIIMAAGTVTIGRLSDMFGRVRLYNAGFLLFSIASFLLYLSSVFIVGAAGAISMIILRIFQGIGGAFLLANSTAIIIDAFPHNERGMATGINQIGFIGGSLIGLILGGVLAVVDWHLIFLINVPIGIFGTVWAYMMLKEVASIRKEQKFDILGNMTFGAALVVLLLSLTYALLPYGSSSMGWSSPFVDAGLVVGVLLLAAFAYVEGRAKDPMFDLKLFKIRAFSAGIISQFLASMTRGGLQFVLIIWLQGVWLPLHGVSFENTPLTAGLDMVPLILGFLVFGPISGKLSDRMGSRLLATLGMAMTAIGFVALALLPVDFGYVEFALIIFFLGAGGGVFSSPNITSIMNAVPPEQRGSVSGTIGTIYQVAFMFSLVSFFTLLVFGLSTTLPASLYQGLVGQQVSPSVALSISKLPPTAALFAAFLGYNPMKTMIPQSVLSGIPQANSSVITGVHFFPEIISSPVASGLRVAFILGAIMAVVAAIAAGLRGPKYVHGESSDHVVTVE